MIVLRGSLCTLLLASLCLGLSPGADARELLLSLGAGRQPGGDQSNRLASVDFTFHTFERSARRHISVGVAFTQLEADTAPNDRMEVISVYPEFSYYPAAGGRIRESMPERAEPYFFTRFLGASYISANALGDRRQDNHFTFLAEVGVGVLISFGDRRRSDFRLSWKHFSNARLFDDNDGIDVPLVLSWGLRY
jgi:hypothetical protein